MTYYPSLKDLDAVGVKTVFVPLERLELLANNDTNEWADFMDVVRTYDPKQCYVLFISCGVSKTALNKNENDAIWMVRKVTCAKGDLGVSTFLPINALSPVRRRCAFCKVPLHQLKNCSLCNCVSYCGRRCQKKDWSTHKKRCHTVKAARKDGKNRLSDIHKRSDGGSCSSSARPTCAYCRLAVSTLRVCGSCRNAQYCSKGCQTSHWSTHKSVCHRL
jgi:hypothetical protein